jgi:hypothetical protein
VNVTAIYESFEAVVALLPAFFNVSALLALCVGISGWLAAITFDDLDFENREGVDVNDGFDSLGTSIYTMFFVSTTANFPDQMLPSFTYRRTFGLFFFIYVLLAVFIFLNLILAVVYNEYSDFVKGRVIEANRNRARASTRRSSSSRTPRATTGARRSRATPSRSSSSTRTTWSACPAWKRARSPSSSPSWTTTSPARSPRPSSTTSATSCSTRSSRCGRRRGSSGTGRTSPRRRSTPGSRPS